MTAQPRIREDEPAWREIESTLAEIVRLSKSDITFDELASELLERAVRMLAARGGAVWLTDADQKLRLHSQVNLQSLAVSPDDDSHRHLLEQAVRDGKPQVTSPKSSKSTAEAGENSSDSLLIIHPLMVGDEVVGLFELIQRPTTNAAVLRGNQRLVTVVCEAAGDHLQRNRLSDMRRADARSLQFEQFARQLHQSLDLRRVSFELANEGRLFTGCDRITVVVRRGRGYRVMAVSGVDVLNRRSNLVRQLESLATTVARMGEPLWFEGDTAEIPEQIVNQLDAFIDQSHARVVAVVPMVDCAASPPSNVGVLIAEQFERTVESTQRQRIQSVASQGALATKNALTYRNLPTVPFARRLQDGQTVLKTGRWGSLLTLIAAVSLVVVLSTVQADFEIGARGELQPWQRLDVFAPQDGTVIDVRVDHDDSVADGQILVIMESAEIDLQLDKARGERDTTQKRLLAVESALLQFNPSDDRSPLGGERLAADKEELKLQLAGQQRQHELLRSQQAELQVRSPLKGRVLTWEVRRRLADRPVQRGQSLMTVADLSGNWIAELQVPDDRIGFVLAAQRNRDEPLEVSFELATLPGEIHHGVLEEIANRVELSDQQPSVSATVSFDHATIPQLRPGATILARIHCGQKPLGYVWLHDLISTVRKWILL